MAVFSKADFLDGKCLHQELGKEHEPRWGLTDAKAGRCSQDMVGARRDIPLELEALNVDDVVQRALNKIGAEEFAAYLADRYDIMAPLVAKKGLDNLARTQEKPKDLSSLTKEEIASLTTHELKLAILRDAGITTWEEAMALGAKD